MLKFRTLYSLKDKITKKFHLYIAGQKVLDNGGCGGVDNVSIEEFKNNYKMNMRELHRQLIENTYEPLPVLRTYISKGNGEKRPLGIPVIKDRIAQQAVRQVLEIYFEREFCECSFGFRPNRSAHDAIEKIEKYKEKNKVTTGW